MWMTFGLACYAVEMMQASIRDIVMKNLVLLKASARQSDLTDYRWNTSTKNVFALKSLRPMPEPRYVMSVGSCANGGGYYRV